MAAATLTSDSRSTAENLTVEAANGMQSCTSPGGRNFPRRRGTALVPTAITNAPGPSTTVDEADLADISRTHP